MVNGQAADRLSVGVVPPTPPLAPSSPTDNHSPHINSDIPPRIARDLLRRCAMWRIRDATTTGASHARTHLLPSTNSNAIRHRENKVLGFGICARISPRSRPFDGVDLIVRHPIASQTDVRQPKGCGGLREVKRPRLRCAKTKSQSRECACRWLR